MSDRNFEHCTDFAQATERDREAVLAVAAGPATALGEVERHAIERIDELARMDERVLPLVRRIGNKALEEIAKIKVDSTVRQNEDLGRKVHRS